MHDFSQAPELIAEVNEAFSDTSNQTLKEVVPLVAQIDVEAISAQKAFENKNWTDISLDYLTRNEGFTRFISEEALYFFLPSIVRASLSLDGIYALAPHFLHVFSTDNYGDLADTTNKYLDKSKRRAIYNYILFLASEFPDVFDDTSHIYSCVKFWENLS